MHKYKICLETLKDSEKFAREAEKIKSKIVVKDNSGHCVNGKSLLGMLYALEFEELWCETEEDLSIFILPFLSDKS